MIEKIKVLLCHEDVEIQQQAIVLLESLYEPELLHSLAQEIELSDTTKSPTRFLGRDLASDTYLLRPLLLFCNVLYEQAPQHLPKIKHISFGCLHKGDTFPCLEAFPLEFWSQTSGDELPKSLSKCLQLKKLEFVHCNALPDWISEIKQLDSFVIHHYVHFWPSFLEDCPNLNNLYLQIGGSCSNIPKIDYYDKLAPILQKPFLAYYKNYEKDIFFTWLVARTDVQSLRLQKKLLGTQYFTGKIESGYSYSSVDRTYYKLLSLFSRMEAGLLRKPLHLLDCYIRHSLVLPTMLLHHPTLKCITLKTYQYQEAKILTLPNLPFASLERLELEGWIIESLPPKFLEQPPSFLSFENCILRTAPDDDLLKNLPVYVRASIIDAHLNSFSEEQEKEKAEQQNRWSDIMPTRMRLKDDLEPAEKEALYCLLAKEDPASLCEITSLELSTDSPVLEHLHHFKKLCFLTTNGNISNWTEVISRVPNLYNWSLKTEHPIAIDWSGSEVALLESSSLNIMSFEPPTPAIFTSLPERTQYKILHMVRKSQDYSFSEYKALRDTQERDPYPLYGCYSNGTYNPYSGYYYERSIKDFYEHALWFELEDNPNLEKAVLRHTDTQPFAAVLDHLIELRIIDGIIPSTLSKVQNLKILHVDEVKKLDELFDSHSLEVLLLKGVLGAIQMVALPDQWNRLPKLRVLSIKYHELYELPPTLKKAESIEELHLCDDIFENLDLRGMHKLKKLRLTASQVNSELFLPSSLVELSISRSPRLVSKVSFEDIPNLEVLWMQSCKIQRLPTTLNKLTALRSLSLSGNPLQDIAQLQDLLALKKLFLAGTPFANSLDVLRELKLEKAFLEGIEQTVDDTPVQKTATRSEIIANPKQFDLRGYKRIPTQVGLQSKVSPIFQKALEILHNTKQNNPLK